MIELNEVAFEYRGGKRALVGASARLSSPTTAILGPNGAGKTTLMGILATSRKPTAGYIKVDDQVISGRRSIADHRASLGVMPQQLSIFPAYTCLEFLMYVAWLRKVPGTKRTEQCNQALEATGLQEQVSARVGTLSGGMRQRLGLAQALVNKPRLLLMDEPTVGLDPEQRRNFRSLLREVSTGTTICLATHLTEDAAAVAQSLLVLVDGNVLFCGTTPEFCKQYGYETVTGETVEASYIACLEASRSAALRRGREV